MSFKKYEDKDRLLKLIEEFKNIRSIEELASVVYIIIQKHDERFSYEEEDFEDFSLLGPISRKLFEDLFHLEVREEYVKRGSTMTLTKKGKERVQRLGEEITFSDVKDILSYVDRDLWPKTVALLYLRQKYGVRRAAKVLKRGYEVDEESFKTLKDLVTKLVP